jgi:hypothetical protein
VASMPPCIRSSQMRRGFLRSPWRILWEPEVEDFIGFKCVFRHDKS